MIRVAAVADLHLGVDSRGTISKHLPHLRDHADLFLIAGDLTKVGAPAEAEMFADELRDSPVPVVVVLGNHDYHSDQDEVLVKTLADAGVHVLDGSSVTFDIDDEWVGIAGVKGFASGFPGASASDFGEPEMKAFVAHTKLHADRLEQALREIEGCDVRICLLHYAPIMGTLVGERLEIYAFLGSSFLGEAIDRVGCDIVFHGHAHAGSEKGTTPGGIPVRNVAHPVIRHAYNLYCLGSKNGNESCEAGPERAAEVVGARRVMQ